MVVEMVVGLVAVAVLVKVAGALHSDPRPFVQDPSVHPWFSHSADDGFPSDHAAVGAVTSFVVVRRRVGLGSVMLVATALLAAARVVAHVHHVQDVVAGGVIGLVAATAGAGVWRAVREAPLVRHATGQLRPKETTSPGSDGAP
jgi:undecaprenyl-diphosphatase